MLDGVLVGLCMCSQVPLRLQHAVILIHYSLLILSNVFRFSNFVIHHFISKQSLHLHSLSLAGHMIPYKIACKQVFYVSMQIDLGILETVCVTMSLVVT